MLHAHQSSVSGIVFGINVPETSTWVGFSFPLAHLLQDECPFIQA